nr:receptor-like serine/threonine-protein kinase SD1-8 isoform X2 [Ipomoea trifida]
MRAAMESGSFLFWYFLILQILIPRFTIAVDTITPTQPLAQNQTLVSAGGVFQLGFFSPDGNSSGLYVGIWYKEIQDKTIVWVANRDKPITNSTGFLKIGEDGNINLVDGTGNSIWSSSNQSVRGNTIAQLLDSGNLVLRRENDENPENYLWESFEYPTDTSLVCNCPVGFKPRNQQAWSLRDGSCGCFRCQGELDNSTYPISSSKVATKIEDEVLRERSSSRSCDEISEESSRVIKFTIPKGELDNDCELDNNEIHKLAKDLLVMNGSGDMLTVGEFHLNIVLAVSFNNALRYVSENVFAFDGEYFILWNDIATLNNNEMICTTVIDGWCLLMNRTQDNMKCYFFGIGFSISSLPFLFSCWVVWLMLLMIRALSFLNYATCAATISSRCFCFLILDRCPDSQFDCILFRFISFIAPCMSPSDLDPEFWIWVDSDDGTPSSATTTTIRRDGDFFTPGQAFRANRKGWKR